MKLWVVGKTGGASWEFQGVFSTEERAVAACRDEMFVGPAELDRQLPHDTWGWDGAYYPLAGKR